MSEVPLLAVTMGDPAGIGPEVLVKALALSREHGAGRDWCPVVYGHPVFVAEALRLTGVGLSPVEVAGAAAARDLDAGQVGIVRAVDAPPQAVTMGEVSAEAGRVAVRSFERAVDDALAGRVDGVVTCPINKEAVHAAGFVGDIGHQEILARKTAAPLTATMLMTSGLRVAHLSTHKSLAEAVAYVRAPVLVDKLRLTVESLRRWGIRAPRVAVAALNPHGGEGGMLGREELDEIAPAVARLRGEGAAVSGPFPADSVFYRAVNGEFDAVMALYHDQGHIAIKMHDFENSVSATMGIPFVRTSVDHGTAFDIAGRNVANPVGLLRALDAAVAMIHGRLA